MQTRRSTNFGGSRKVDPVFDYARDDRPHRTSPADSNSPEDVFGEIGLVLVVVLGIVLAINVALVALHIV